MKQWVRLSIILMVAICAVGAGIVVATHARAAINPPPKMQVSCQVQFLDGPNQGNDELVSFTLVTNTLTASSGQYIGGQSTSGSWQYTDATDQTASFTFSAQLAVIPGATLTVITTIPVSTTTVSGPSQGTVVDSSGNVLFVAHSTTTCPSFVPPPLCSGLMCANGLPPADRVRV